MANQVNDGRHHPDKIVQWEEGVLRVRNEVGWKWLCL
jgi:hypothetical protein